MAHINPSDRATPILVAMVIGAAVGWIIGPKASSGVEVLGFFEFSNPVHQLLKMSSCR